MFVFNVKRSGSSDSFKTGGTLGTFPWFGFGLAFGDTMLKTGVIVEGVVFGILSVTAATSSLVSLKIEDIFT
jgi:hypothetical protein